MGKSTINSRKVNFLSHWEMSPVLVCWWTKDTGSGDLMGPQDAPESIGIHHGHHGNFPSGIFNGRWDILRRATVHYCTILYHIFGRKHEKTINWWMVFGSDKTYLRRMMLDDGLYGLVQPSIKRVNTSSFPGVDSRMLWTRCWTSWTRIKRRHRLGTTVTLETFQ